MKKSLDSDLPAAILRTKEEITQLKRQLEQITDPREQRRLKRRIKKLQILQLWQLGKFMRG